MKLFIETKTRRTPPGIRQTQKISDPFRFVLGEIPGLIHFVNRISPRVGSLEEVRFVDEFVLFAFRCKGLQIRQIGIRCVRASTEQSAEKNE